MFTDMNINLETNKSYRFGCLFLSFSLWSLLSSFFGPSSEHPLFFFIFFSFFFFFFFFLNFFQKRTKKTQ